MFLAKFEGWYVVLVQLPVYPSLEKKNTRVVAITDEHLYPVTFGKRVFNQQP